MATHREVIGGAAQPEMEPTLANRTMGTSSVGFHYADLGTPAAQLGETPNFENEFNFIKKNGKGVPNQQTLQDRVRSGPEHRMWISAEEQYTEMVEQIPRDVENIIWNMMVVKAPLMDAYEVGTRVLHIPVDGEPRNVSVIRDGLDFTNYKTLIGGDFDALWLWGGYYLYLLDYAPTGPINRFLFKHLGLVVRGNVVIMRQDDECMQVDYVPIDWKDTERNLIKMGHCNHYIYNPLIKEELYMAGLIDADRKRI